jgi:hypothetical protein
MDMSRSRREARVPITREKAALERSAARNLRTSASAIYGFDSVMTSPVRGGVIDLGPTVGQTGIDAHPSWGFVAVQHVGDYAQANDVARAAGRRMVRKYGEALERLAD